MLPIKSQIIGVCGLQGAGKTTIAEGLCTPMPAPAKLKCKYSILDYICDVVIFGFPNRPRHEIRPEIDALLKHMIDPKYGEIVDDYENTQYGNAYLQNTQACYAREIYFSYAVKQITCALFIFPWDLISAVTPELRAAREMTESRITFTNTPIPRMTARGALEYIGTEVFRNGFHPDIWVNITFSVIALMHNVQYVFISDTRFLNEAQAIKQNVGNIIVVYRAPEDLVLTESIRKTHVSNWSFLEFPPELIHACIHNSGTKMELIEKVKKYLN